MPRPRTPPPTLASNVPTVFSSRETLLATGMRSREITAAVRAGSLLRVRRGRYLAAGCHSDVADAVRAGGRVDCVSLLALYGVFIAEHTGIHAQIPPESTRLAAPSETLTRHWRPTSASADAVLAPLIEALAQAARCQPPRAAIATLDSAWHLGLVDPTGIAQVFALLPRRYRRLRGLLDARAESGTETFVRLMLRGLGCRIQLQAKIPGVGFVDLLVEGWLIIECDSKAYHSTWDDRRRDIRRDAKAATLGYLTLRLLAEDILHRPEYVLATLRTVLARGPVATPGR